MLQNIIVLSLLIAAVIALRLIFKKKVSARVIYALWLAVVIKLCIPFSIPILPQVSLPENAPVQDSTVISAQEHDPSYTQEYTSGSETQKWENTPFVPAIGENFGAVEIGTGENVSAPSAPAYPKEEIADTPDYSVNFGESVTQTGETSPMVGTEAADNDAVKSSFDVVKALAIAWAVCSAATALFFMINGTIFAVRLRRDRTYVGKIKRAKIYSTSAITTPCVFGIIPTVYIPPELNERSEYDLAISHELTHISHGDNLWTVVRVLALIAYPWNPLVWAAAILSKRDAEFACDEAVTAKMSRDEKLDYAQMLVDSAPVKRSIVTGLGSAPLKERIIMLTKNRKKSILISVIAISLVVPCIFGSFVGFVNADSEKNDLNPFSDVSEDAYYYDAVVWANQNNIMNGTSKTEFSPDDTCTRAEVVTCLWKMMGEPEPLSKRKRFYDVEEPDSFYKAVMWAYKSGIARGTSTNYFSPSKPCTYAEVLTMVWRAEGSHWNVGRGEWYTDACNWANMMNLSCNACEGTFPPTSLCPRRDVATLIYRSLKMNSVEEWMREYKGYTLGELIDKGEIDYYAGTTDSGNRYFMTNYFGLYILTDGRDNDSKVLGAQFFGSNWVTENGISPLMKGVPANRNFNSWEKLEVSSDMDGQFFTYCTDTDGNSVKAVWEISTTVYLQWKENTADLSLEERLISYTELVESNQSSPIGYVYTYFVTYPEEMLGEVTEPDEKNDDVADHALNLALYFREDVTDAEELIDNPHLYEFLVNSVYALYKDNVISLEDVSEKEWDSKYLIPNDYMEKAAALLLGIESNLPEKFYAVSDFGYTKDTDTFLYSPFSPPMFNTVRKSVTQTDDGVFAVTVEISNVDGVVLNELVYTFKTVTDADWGEMYQLVSIDKPADTNESGEKGNDREADTNAPDGVETIESQRPIPFLEIDQFMDYFVRFFHEEYSSGDELKGNVLYAMSMLCICAGYNESPTFDLIENLDEGFFAVKQDDLVHVTEMILGKNVDLTKYHETFCGVPDGYFPEENAYHFAYGGDFRNDDPCFIDHNTVQITETDNSLVYTATVNLYDIWFSDNIVETKNLTYTFDKNVSDGLIYYKLVSIKET